MSISHAEEMLLVRLRTQTLRLLGVELRDLYDVHVQNQIIFIVNGLGNRFAVACANQNKENRGEKVGSPDEFFGGDFAHLSSWKEAVNFTKREWYLSRNLALLLCPEIEGDLRHFNNPLR